MLPPILVELKANSREFVTGMKEAQHEVQKLGTGSAAHMQKFAAVGKAALFGIAGVATVVGVGSLEMADKFEVSHAKIVAALKDSGTSIDVWGSQISNADKYMEKLGFTNAQTEDTLARLTIALGDPNKALQVMGTAANLARAKNIDLASAGVMVARAMEGNSRALKQMGIDLPVNAKSAENLKVAQNNLRFATEAYHTQLTRLHEKHKVTAADLETVKTAHDRLKFAQQQVNEAQKSGTLILDALNKRLGGQSQQYTESFAGKVTVLKAQLEDLGVKIGLALIPVLEKAATITASVVNWFEKHSEVAKILAIAVGTVLVVAIGAYTVAMVSAAAATIAATWPILAVIAAVALVGVGIYELATHWHTVWTDVSGFVKRHVNIIAGAMAVLLGPVGLLVAAGLELAVHWKGAWGALKIVFDGIRTGAVAVANFFTGPFLQAIGSFVSVFVTGVRYLFTVWSTVVGGIIDGAAKALGWVPGVGGKLKAAARAFDGFRSDVTTKLAQVANDASGWGQTVGFNIGMGVVSGLHASDIPVVTAASGLAAKAIAALKAKARVTSPSKETIYIGQMMAQGLIDGFKGHTLTLVNKLGDALRQMLDKVHARIVAATQRTTDAVKAARDKLGQDLATSAQFAGGIAQNILGGSALSGAFDSNGALGSITDYLTGKLAASSTELGDIRGLKAAGLNATTLNDLAGMSPDQEMAVAGQLRQPGQVGQVNSLQAQLAATADQIGKAVADATYGTQLAGDRKAVADQIKEQKKQTALLEHIAHHLGIDIARALTSPQGAKALRDALIRLNRTGTNLGLT